MKNGLKLIAGSFFAGLCNSMFGSGGGILLIPMLESLNLTPKKAHATSVAVIAIFSVFSFAGYVWGGNFKFMSTIWFIPSGILGAIIGSIVLKKIKISWLKRVFGVLILITSLRLLFK